MDIKKTLVPESGKLQIDENGLITAVVLDADFDAFTIEFDEHDRMELHVGDMEYIALGREELKQLGKLLREAEKELDRQDEVFAQEDSDLIEPQKP